MRIGKYLTLKHEIILEEKLSGEKAAISARVTMKPFESVIVSENRRYSEIKGTRNVQTLDITYNSEETSCVIKFFLPNNTITEVANVASTLFNAVKNGSPADAIKEFSYPKIYDMNNQLIGTMDYYLVDMNDPSQNYPGFKFTYYDKVYTLFQTPSHFSSRPALCVYENDQKLVAEIVFDGRAGFYTDLPKYDIYVEENEYFSIASILTVVWHQMREELFKTNTNLVHLKARYSASFIDNIRNNVGSSYLPENMPLAKQLYKASKFDIRRILPKIIGLIIVLALVIYIIISSING